MIKIGGLILSLDLQLEVFSDHIIKFECALIQIYPYHNLCSYYFITLIYISAGKFRNLCFAILAILFGLVDIFQE